MPPRRNQGRRRPQMSRRHAELAPRYLQFLHPELLMELDYTEHDHPRYIIRRVSAGTNEQWHTRAYAAAHSVLHGGLRVLYASLPIQTVLDYVTRFLRFMARYYNDGLEPPEHLPEDDLV